MKTKVIRSAIPIYIAAAVWILYGLALPLYKITHILMATGLSVVAYMVAGKFFVGSTVEVAPTSANAEVDRQIKEALAQLETIKAAGQDIHSPELSKQILSMEKSGKEILHALAEKPERASQVRKFMNYYLPTATKLLDQYRKIAGVTTDSVNIDNAKKSVEGSMGLIAKAFEKQLDRLYRDEALDMTSDVKVLETMMAGDGLTGAGQIKSSTSEQAQAASASEQPIKTTQEETVPASAAVQGESLMAQELKEMQRDTEKTKTVQTQ